MNTIILLLLAVASSAVNAAELLDPNTRDEDISAVDVSVKVSNLDGKRLYRYSVSKKAPTIGELARMEVDIYCAGYPDLGQGFGFAGRGKPFNVSKNQKHVPVELNVIGSSTASRGVNAGNLAVFSMFGDLPYPITVDILSPARPGYRRYILRAQTADNDSKYDYSAFNEEDFYHPPVPTDRDWEVHGVIPGPACPGQEANPMTRPIMPGQHMPNETYEMNERLRYEVKGNRNRWHDLATTTDVKFRIYYASSVDPAAFKATLNSRDVSSLFHPSDALGHYEEVTLPLDGVRTLIHFTACDASAKRSDGSYDVEKCDVDPFEIRRTVPAVR